MKKLKFLVAVIFSLISFAGTLGCAGGNAVEGTITIRYFEGGFGSQWLIDATNAYKELNPGVQFKLDKDPNVNTQLLTYISAKNPNADIYMTDSAPWQSGAVEGNIAPLDDLFEESVGDAGNTVLKDALVPYLTDFPYVQTKVDDASTRHPYVIPWTANTFSFVYNEDLMKKIPKTKGAVGEKWNKFPETEAELKDFIDDINTASLPVTPAQGNKKVVPFVRAGSETNNFAFLHETWWAQYQGMYTDGKEGEGTWRDFYNFETPDVYAQSGITQGFRLLQDLFVDTSSMVPIMPGSNGGTPGAWKNVPTGCGSMNAADAELSFIKGEAVIALFGSWMENETKDMFGLNFAYPNIGEHMRMAYIPAVEGAKETKINNAMVGSVFCVSQKSVNVDISKEFLKFLNTPAQMLKFTQATGMMRPYSTYNPLNDDTSHTWSKFNRDCIQMFLDGNNLFRYSEHPFFTHLGKTAYIPTNAGSLGNILTSTPEQCTDYIHGYASSAWNDWKTRAGIVG